MKLLIIEGLDRVGKNTLINNLTNQAENYVVRHFGSAKGDTDLDKQSHQFDFFKKEFELANLRNRFEMPDKQRYPNDIWIWNRAHLGEYVYGKLYRNTFPERWVIDLEKLFGLNLDPSVYLVYLWAPAEFLCSRDDGKSFTSDIVKKDQEIKMFDYAFEKSTIINKIKINVSNHNEYLDSDIIFDQINKFLNNKK